MLEFLFVSIIFLVCFALLANTEAPSEKKKREEKQKRERFYDH